MLLVLPENKSVDVSTKIKLCWGCQGKPGQLTKFFSHNGKRKSYVCSNCIKSLGKPRIQQMLDQIPLNDGRERNFKREGVVF